ncbi:uridine kinase [Enteropsectra breve]|nr:uridine kinase [Enteropsectra breve]
MNLVGTFKESIKMLIMQGGSCSGKSTLARVIAGYLKEKGERVVTICLDDYYRDTSDIGERVKDYDFDNPAAFDWKHINEALQTYSNPASEEVVYYTYDKDSMRSTKHVSPNPKPTVIIVEGIYAFNCVDRMAYNVSQFDPFKTAKVVVPEKIPSAVKYENCNIFKIGLKIDKKTMIDLRVKRDSYLIKSRTVDETISRIDNNVWPATSRWINNFSKEDCNMIIDNSGGMFIHNLRCLRFIDDAILGISEVQVFS